MYICRMYICSVMCDVCVLACTRVYLRLYAFEQTALVSVLWGGAIWVSARSGSRGTGRNAPGERSARCSSWLTLCVVAPSGTGCGHGDPGR